MVWRRSHHLYYKKKIIPLVCRLFLRSNVFKRKYFLFSKCSSEHIECSFDNNRQNFLLKTGKKSKIFRKNCSKCSSGHVKISFGETSFCLNLFLLSWGRAPPHPRVPRFFFKFWTFLFLSHFWPTVEGKYHGTLPLVLIFSQLNQERIVCWPKKFGLGVETSLKTEFLTSSSQNIFCHEKRTKVMSTNFFCYFVALYVTAYPLRECEKEQWHDEPEHVKPHEQKGQHRWTEKMNLNFKLPAKNETNCDQLMKCAL